jgi:hypothetical protein
MNDISHTFEALQGPVRRYDGLKRRNEEAIRHWVRRAVTDPIRGSTRQYYYDYCSSVVGAESTTAAHKVLSYSAFCRRVIAAKRQPSSLHRVHCEVDFPPHRNKAQGKHASEALWVLQLPAPNDGRWIDPHGPLNLVTVAIAVDALAGTVRVDSQFVGSHPNEQVAILAVRHYKRQHGRSPNPVCIDHADFQSSSRLRQVCQNLGIELRIVCSPRRRLTPSLLLAPGHQTANEVGVAATSRPDLVKAIRDPFEESMRRGALLPRWRGSQRGFSLRRTPGENTRLLRGETSTKEEVARVDAEAEQ